MAYTKETFFSYTVETPSGCWLWTRAKKRDGYGVCWTGDKTERAHRVAYRLEYGEIPIGLVIDHLCRNPSCVNPTHLEAVPQSANVQRGMRGRLKTHCPKGHEYTPNNTRYGAGRHANSRHCRTCNRESAVRANERKRVEREAVVGG